jgi:hypothetical protein
MTEKGKGKEQPASATTAPKPRAKVAKAGLATVSPPPVAGPSAPRVRPGPLGIRRPYVEITVSRKRKFVEVEESNNDLEDDEGNHEDDDDDEDAYMAGRLNGLNTFVAMFETAFGALKKEVAEIDSYIVNKRRRRNQ